MKASIHPKWYPEAKVIVNDKVVMTVGATQPELHVEVWSGTHPFYTGKKRLMDTKGRIEAFRAKESGAKKTASKNERRKLKRQSKIEKMMEGPDTLADLRVVAKRAKS